MKYRTQYATILTIATAAILATINVTIANEADAFSEARKQRRVFSDKLMETILAAKDEKE